MKTLIITAALLATADAAQADTIGVVFTGTQRGQNVAIDSPWHDGNVFAGQLKHTLSNGTGASSALNGHWITFCTDLNQYVTQSVQSYDVVSVSSMPDNQPMGALKAAAIADMYTYAAGSHLLTTTSNDLAAAFQLAVWEIVIDYTAAAGHNLSITSGSFQATATGGSALTAGVSTQLSNLFAAVGNVSGTTSLIGVRSGSSQDQLIPVPAAGPLALAGLGLLCVARRKR